MASEQTGGRTTQGELPSPGAAGTSFWSRIKEHKVVQWTLAYAAAAYTLLHATEMVSDALDWPHIIIRLVTILLFLGLPIATTLAWYHGHRAQHRVSGPEFAILTVLLVIAGSVLWFIGRPSHGHDAGIAGAEDQRAAAVNVSAGGAIAERSIAVLPFSDMSEKHDQDYFGDGMAEEIINLLVKIPELKVIGRTSSFQFKGKADDLRKIGTTLRATYVVEGSVRRAGDHVRVTAQLIDTRDGAHRWSETYDRGVSDVLAVQDEIAASLVRALQLEITSLSHLQGRAQPKNSEVYDSYLRGLHAFNRYDQHGFDEAAAEFKRTLDADPSFVPAAEQLARTLCDQASWGFVPAHVGFEQARVAANDAIKLDSKSALAHAMLGCVLFWHDWDWPTAGQEMTTAVTLAPNDPTVLIFASEERIPVGKWAEALRLCQAAITADPLHAGAYEGCGWVYVRLGRLAEAESAYRRMLEISPTYVGGHHDLGVVLLMQGKSEAALTEMQKETPVGGHTAGLAVAYHAVGRTKDSDRELARLEAEHSNDMAMWIAEACAYRGQKSDALKWLDRAYAQKDIFLWLIKGDPLLKNLEVDPRYKAFLRKMNLPEMAAANDGLPES